MSSIIAAGGLITVWEGKITKGSSSSWLLHFSWSPWFVHLGPAYSKVVTQSADIDSLFPQLRAFLCRDYLKIRAFCTFLAMVATLPLAQLCFFHMLLVKKGISTYDYFIALREQEREQATGDQESPQMSRVSSMTGLSRTSPFNAFHRGAWCTPPRSFPEEQFDVVHPNTITSVDYSSKKALVEESTIRRNVRAVKISPWTLARLNAEEVSKAAAQARRKSKVLQPRAEELQELISLSTLDTVAPKGVQISGSTSDGYEASGGEDSDQTLSRIMHKSSNWTDLFRNSGCSEIMDDFQASSSSARLQPYGSKESTVLVNQFHLI
ncbi:probable protein S-acyltransferase 22 isoform X2 [Musa acuminata AAA Group]|uniref:probable protein S-acyltransferase 22 isoform X2 n=1 Tax=Musa acuminata AAA Group TaxID=214697 RepID=UPI0031E06BC6